MSARPVIGIVPTHLPTAGDIRLACNYADAVISAGGAPVILPLTEDEMVYEQLFPLLDGVLLTGGHDVDPVRWSDPHQDDTRGEAPNSACANTFGMDSEPDITPLRDAVEWRLVAYAIAHDLPIYGICRGLQVLNAFFGGTLYEDLPRDFSPQDDEALCEHNAHTPEGDYDGERLCHAVTFAEDSQLARIFDTERLTVNSLHHQAARAVAPELRATAYAPDGVVEGVEAKDGRPIVAVQWHPEYFGTTAPMNRFFQALVAESAARAATRSRRS